MSSLLRNLQTDFLKIIELNLKDKLRNLRIRNDKKSVICVVLASKSYPGKFKKIRFSIILSKAKCIKDVEIFHAGTLLRNNKIVSSGGRVLSITAKADSISLARKLAYKVLSIIVWKEWFL